MGATLIYVSDDIMWRRRPNASQRRDTWIPPPHNIWCLSRGRGTPLRGNTRGAQCSSSIFVSRVLKRLRKEALGAEMDRIAGYFFSFGYKQASAKLI